MRTEAGERKRFSLYSTAVRWIVRLDRRTVSGFTRRREMGSVKGHSNVPASICLYTRCDLENRIQAIAYFSQQVVAIFGRGGRSSEVTDGPDHLYTVVGSLTFRAGMNKAYSVVRTC